MRNLFSAISFISVSLCCILCTACTSAFPNDELDYMWRLDRIEFLDGLDFFGNECDMKSAGDIWYCFAREIVEIHFSDTKTLGKTAVGGNSITIDFSGYNHNTGYDPEKMLERLNALGLEASCTEYSIDELNGSTMILTGRKTRLYFTRW